MVGGMLATIPNISYYMGAENHIGGNLRPADIFKLSRHASHLDELHSRVNPHIAVCSNNWVVLRAKKKERVGTLDTETRCVLSYYLMQRSYNDR